MATTKLDASQIQKAVYDETLSALRVVMPLLTTQVELDAADGDNVRIWNGEEPVGWDYYSQLLSVGNTVVTRIYRIGGASGTIVGTTVYTYSDNTRTFLVSLARS